MNGRIVDITANGVLTAVAGASAQCSSTLIAGKLYQFTSNTNCWIKQGTGVQTAAVASGNIYVGANSRIYLHGSNGPNVSVIQDTAPGNCCLSQVSEI